VDKTIVNYIWKEKRNIVNEHLSILKPYFSTIFPYIEDEKLKKIATNFWEIAFSQQQKATHTEVNLANFVENYFNFFSLEMLQTVIFTAPKALYNFFSKEREKRKQNITYTVDLALKYLHENVESWIKIISNEYVKLLKTKLHTTSKLLSFHEKAIEIISMCIDNFCNGEKKYNVIFDKFAELINFTNVIIYEGDKLIYSYKDFDNELKLKKLPSDKKYFLCGKKRGFIITGESKEFLVFFLNDYNSSRPQCKKILLTFLTGEVKNFSPQQKQLLYLLLKLVELKESIYEIFSAQKQ